MFTANDRAQFRAALLTADPTAPASYAWPDLDLEPWRAANVAAALERLEAERVGTLLDDAIRRTGIESAGTLARAARMANA